MSYVIGNVYIADQGNHLARKITVSTGIITTIAGTGINSYSGDGGQATSATLNTPRDLKLDSSGRLKCYFLYVYCLYISKRQRLHR